MLKMGYQSGQLTIVSSLPTVESVPLFTKGLKRFNIFLLPETLLVTIAAILAIRLLATSSISNAACSNAAWLVSPGILVAAALIPTAIKKAEFAEIGFNIT